MDLKAQQLVFRGLLAAGPPPADREYVRGVRVDRAGLARYLHLIRDPDDPERSPRPIGGRADRSPHRTLAELSAEACGNEILALLADGRPRTFNAIGVELLDHTADTLHGSPYEKALWELAARGALEHTLDVPVLFRSPRSGEGVR
jgi:hypothetical protein